MIPEASSEKLGVWNTHVVSFSLLWLIKETALWHNSFTKTQMRFLHLRVVITSSLHLIHAKHWLSFLRAWQLPNRQALGKLSAASCFSTSSKHHLLFFPSCMVLILDSLDYTSSRITFRGFCPVRNLGQARGMLIIGAAFPGASHYLNNLVTVLGEPIRKKRISSDP